MLKEQLSKCPVIAAICEIFSPQVKKHINNAKKEVLLAAKVVIDGWINYIEKSEKEEREKEQAKEKPKKIEIK
jgi:hypothetical protein